MAIFLPGNVERDFQAPDEFTTTLGDYTSAKFQEGLDSNPVQLFKDMYKFQEANAPTQPRLKPDEIKDRTEQEGVDVDIPADGLSQLALDIMIDRKKKQKKLSEAIDNSPTGFRSLAGLGASLGAGLLDPLNVGLSFVPVVGQARYASMIARQSGMLGRVGVRAGVGAVEGAVGTAIIEPFMYGMHQTLQDDYDAVDSLLNIGLGSVLGGGLHVVGGAGVDAYKKWRTSDGLDPLPPKVDAPLENPTPTNALEPIKTDAPISQPQPNANALPDVATARLDPNSAAAVTEFATPQTREAALRSAVGQIVEGKQVDVEAAFKADPKGVATQTDLPAFKAWFGESKVVDADGKPLVVYHGTTADFQVFDLSRAGEVGENFGSGAFFTSDPGVAASYTARWMRDPEFVSAREAEDNALSAWGKAVVDYGKGSAEAAKAEVTKDAAAAIRRKIADQIDGMNRPITGAQTVPVYIAMKNPLVVDAKGEYYFRVYKTAFQQAADGNHDGIIFRNVIDSANVANQRPSDVFVAFRPNQIKSAIGNSGAFDPNSGSLTDQLTSTIQRQASPESVRVADFEGSKAADEKLATAPKSEALQDAEAELARVMADLEQRIGMPAEAPKETAKPAKKSRAKEDTLLTRLQKMGGISITERMDVTGNNFAPGGYNPVFKKDSKVSLKGAIESGSLDDFLPYEMRLSSSPDEAFDATEAYDYLAEKIRNGEKVVPYEAELQQKFEAYMSELAPYDEAIQAADELSLAAKAAAICDLRG